MHSNVCWLQSDSLLLWSYVCCCGEKKVTEFVLGLEYWLDWTELWYTYQCLHSLSHYALSYYYAHGRKTLCHCRNVLLSVNVCRHCRWQFITCWSFFIPKPTLCLAKRILCPSFMMNWYAKSSIWSISDFNLTVLVYIGWLTQVHLEKWPLKQCVCVCVVLMYILIVLTRNSHPQPFTGCNLDVFFCICCVFEIVMLIILPIEYCTPVYLAICRQTGLWSHSICITVQSCWMEL